MKKLTHQALKDIAEELDVGGMLVYVHTKTGKMYSIPDPDFIYADIEEELWQEAYDEIESMQDDLIQLEKMSSYDAFKTMESFAETVEDPKIKERLFYALNKNKPFKNFKYEIDYHDKVRDDWFKHKNARMIAWVKKQLYSFQDNHNDKDAPKIVYPTTDKAITLNDRRTNIASGAKWENIVGYSRAVRIDNIVEVTGTAAVDAANNIVGMGDAYQQTHFIIQKIEKALQQAGATLADVVRTRIYVTDIQVWEDVGKAHNEFFKDIKPATTLVEVSRLIHPDMLVEIEATAVL